MPAAYAEQAAYDFGNSDIDIDIDADPAGATARYDTPDVAAPGTAFADTDLHNLLSAGFSQERHRLERRHALAAQHLEELEAWFDDVQDRHSEERQRLREEIRPLARRRNDVVSTDEAQQQVLDRLERLYDAALDLRLKYEDRRQWYLDRKHELEEQRVDAVEALEELAAARRTIDQLLDTDL